MIDKIHRLDQDITLAINSLHSSMTDSMWYFFSDKMVWIPLYTMVVALLVYRLGWKKALVCILSIALTIVACDQTSELFKYSVGRLRPCYDTRMLHEGLRILEGRGHRFGFFSAHAADTFGFATCFSLCIAAMSQERKGIKAYTFAIFLWASMVALSRIFLGKHYLGDVLVGALFGMLYGYIISRLAIFITKRLSFFK